MSAPMSIGTAAGYLRAMSPMNTAATIGEETVTEKAENSYVVSAAAAHRHASLQAANTVGEVIAMIPAQFRTILRPLLETIASQWQQLFAARSHLSKWEAHEAAGTFPPWCNTQVPAVMMTKAFEESEEGRTFRSALASGHSAYQKELLSSYIANKKKEIAALVLALGSDILLDKVKPVVEAHFHALHNSIRIPETVEEDGNIRIVRWVQSTLPFDLCRQVLADWVVYADRIRAIVQGTADAAEQRKANKKQIQQSADVEMQDESGPSTGSSIQSAVDRAVNAAVKRITAASVSCSGCPGNSGTYSDIGQTLRSLPQGTAPPFGQEAPSQDGTYHNGPRTKSSGPDRRKRSAPGRQAWTFSAPQGKEAARQRESGKGCWRRQGRQGQTESPVTGTISIADRTVRNSDTGQFVVYCEQCIDAKMASYVYPEYWTLPDEICDIPFSEAVRCVIRNTPIKFIEAARFQSRVHVGPGVSMPRYLELTLGIGMKHMFHQPRNAELITQAYLDFVRRLRWRIKFTLEGEEKTYDPDYDVSEPSMADPPVLPFYCELALKRGRAHVHHVTANVPDDGLMDDSFKPLGPKVHELRKFLLEHDYVLTATDKNLGLAVSERTWIMDNTRACLSNEREYKLLDGVQTQIILDRKCNEMLLLSQRAEIYDWKYGSLGEYLKSSVTGPTGSHHIPRFYGIPKIHKLPVKFRPILPCHSAIQNPAAKFCSKILKPLVAEARTVIHGSKDLAIKLSQLRLTPGLKYYIVTGDVVAYYPNIPLEKCLARISKMLSEWIYTNEGNQNRDWNGLSIDRFLELFNDCLRTGNTELLTQFDGKIYQQLNGLAMGVADSPDLANLYGWFCEKRDGVLNEPRIAYYGRYIDDCIRIVYARNPQEALAIMKMKVNIDDCEITWSVGVAQPFLDMLLYIDHRGRLNHKPYRKAKSLHQRIPWISAHPIDVKRGTFYGEMSRLATLSNNYDDYLEAIDWLVTIYVQRGYSETLLLTWRRNKLKERWDNRLSIKEKETDAVLVLKTEFNTAWNFFGATALGDTILGYMRSWLYKAERMEFSPEFPPVPPDYNDSVESQARFLMETVRSDRTPVEVPDLRRTDILDRRMLVSRKRTTQMFDLASLWKKIVLEKHTDPELGETGSIHPSDQPHSGPPSPPGPSVPARFRRLRSGKVIDLNDDEFSVQRRSVSPLWDENTRDVMAETLSRVRMP